MYAKAGIPIAPALRSRWAMKSISIISSRFVASAALRAAVGNGSSYGISLVHEPSAARPRQSPRRLSTATKCWSRSASRVPRITVGVYGEDDVRALPIVEIRKPKDCEFYDLDVKYVDPTDIHRIPAQISPENYTRAQAVCLRCSQGPRLPGISRSDFIVSEDGPVILETNTIPGMTDTSLYPDEIRHTDDMTFPQVCDSLIRMGFRSSRALHANRGRGFVEERRSLSSTPMPRLPTAPKRSPSALSRKM